MTAKLPDRLRFRDLQGRDVAPAEWLRVWSGQFPSADYPGYEALLAEDGRLSATTIEQIGRWKDAARTDGRWKPNVASVAYRVWMQAASEARGCPAEVRVPEFLSDWSERTYTNRYVSGSVTKRFGLSRATTLLHFLSAGRFPIFDSRVRKALTRLTNARAENSVEWYLESYCPLFSEIAAVCGTTDRRALDKALFSYGGSRLSFLDVPP